MPQDQSQLDPNYDYAQLPDGSYAQFKKGTSEAEMRGRLIAAGKLPATPYQPPKATPQKKTQFEKANEIPSYYGFTPRNVGKNIYQGAKSMVTGTYDLGKTLLGTPDPKKQGGNVEQTLEKIFQPMREQWKQAQEKYKLGRLSEAIGHGTAGLVPMVGPFAAQLGEQAGRGDIGGAVGQAAGAALTAKAGDIAVDKITGFTDPAQLRERAAKLDTKVLKTAQAGAKGYKLATALQVAKEQIYGTLKSLPDKIEAKRLAKNQQVQAIAKQMDATGHTIDVSNEINPITRDVMTIANQRGLLTPQLRTQIAGLLKRITTETDMQTGAQRPRNLSQMKVSDALQLQKGLEDLSAFGKQVPDAINNLARRLRGAIGDKLPDSMQKLRSEESHLITARDAARKNYADALNAGRAGARGFIYSSLPTAGVYVGLKALGLPFAGAIGTALVLRTLGESVPSRTFRAAMYAKAADLLDPPTTRITSPQGPPTAIQPQRGGIQPNAPVGGGNARLTGAPAAGPTGAAQPRTAPATVVSTNPASGLDTVPSPTPLTRGTMLPEKATRARAGSGDYVKESGRNVAESNTKWVKKELKNLAKMPMSEDVKNLGKGLEEKEAALARDKAMMDRLDSLYERQAKPKSGADRNAIEREITEIKRVLSGEAKGADASAINKRIADRERLANKRTEAKAATPGTQTGTASGTTAEPAAPPSASPENRAMLLDLGYKKLGAYEGGAEMVKAMKDHAKTMQKVDPSFDEVTALAEALKALKEVSGQ